jgi:hypothetical protein
MSTLEQESVEVSSFLETIELAGGMAHTGHIIARLGWDLSKIKFVAEQNSEKIKIECREFIGLVFENRLLKIRKRMQQERDFWDMMDIGIHTHQLGYVDSKEAGDGW